MPPLTDLTLVDDVHLSVTLDGPDGPREAFILDLHLAERAPAPADATYLAALSPVVALMGPSTDPATACVVRMGREHRLGDPTVSVVTASVSLPAPAHEPDELDPAERSEQHAALERAVAAAFREVIASTPPATRVLLTRDEALATARARATAFRPPGRGAALALVAEQHHDEEWSLRLGDRSGGGFEVRLGFVDGHPGSTHLRPLHADEVVDSVGAD